MIMTLMANPLRNLNAKTRNQEQCLSASPICTVIPGHAWGCAGLCCMYLTHLNLQAHPHRIHTPTHIYAYTNAHSHTNTHTHSHISHMCIYICVYIDIYVYTYMYMCVRVPVHVLVHVICIHIRIDIQFFAYLCICTAPLLLLRVFQLFFGVLHLSLSVGQGCSSASSCSFLFAALGLV